MDTTVADIIAGKAIANADDKRIEKTLSRIQEAAQALLKDNQKINPTSVGRYCKENYGSPSVQTLRNDHKGIYTPVIDAYAALNSKAETNRKNSDAALKKNLPIEIVSYIAYLERRNDTLSNTLKEQFSITFSEQKPSVRETLRQGATVNDGAKLSSNELFTYSQKSAIKKMYYSLVENEIAELRNMGEGKALVDSQTAEVILKPNEFKSIESFLNDSEQ